MCSLVLFGRMVRALISVIVVFFVGGLFFSYIVSFLEPILGISRMPLVGETVPYAFRAKVYLYDPLLAKVIYLGKENLTWDKALSTTAAVKQNAPVIIPNLGWVAVFIVVVFFLGSLVSTLVRNGWRVSLDTLFETVRSWFSDMDNTIRTLIVLFIVLLLYYVRKVNILEVLGSQGFLIIALLLVVGVIILSQWDRISGFARSVGMLILLAPVGIIAFIFVVSLLLPGVLNPWVSTKYLGTAISLGSYLGQLIPENLRGLTAIVTVVLMLIGISGFFSARRGHNER